MSSLHRKRSLRLFLTGTGTVINYTFVEFSLLCFYYVFDYRENCSIPFLPLMSFFTHPKTNSTAVASPHPSFQRDLSFRWICKFALESFSTRHRKFSKYFVLLPRPVCLLSSTICQSVASFTS